VLSVGGPARRKGDGQTSRAAAPIISLVSGSRSTPYGFAAECGPLFVGTPQISADLAGIEPLYTRHDQFPGQAPASHCLFLINYDIIFFFYDKTVSASLSATQPTRHSLSVTGSSWKSPQRGMRQAWHAEPEREATR
jgi:hypothetical protein